MRTAIYVRVSTQEQAEEGYSIKAQIERLNAYATSQDWKVVKTYVDDGQSAKDMKRRELTRMLDDMKEDVFDCVLVYKLDRLTRSVLDLYTMLNVFEKYNVKFKSATEVYDTTNAMGRLFITLVAALAQWERENLGERVRMGMHQKAKEGKWTVSLTPIGFDKENDFLKINEAEAATVKEIFRLYLSGKYGVGKIAKMLNQRGMKTKSKRNWNFATVHYVLKNKIYIGTMRYNYRVNKEQYFEIENVAPAIIDKADFDEVQRMLKLRSKHHPRKATSPYIFSTVLKCARCGGGMSGKQNGNTKNSNISYSYNCINSRFGTCSQPVINQRFLEIRFLELIKNWDYKKIALQEAVSLEISEVDNVERIKILNKELKEIEERRERWQYAWMNNLISDKDLLKRKEEENENEESVKNELNQLNKSTSVDNENEILASALNDLQQNWIELEPHEKKRFVELLVEKMSVDKVSKERKPESVAITDIEFL